MGGAYPHHMIEMPDKVEKVKEKLQDESIVKAEEIKVCVVTFQKVSLTKMLSDRV